MPCRCVKIGLLICFLNTFWICAQNNELECWNEIGANYRWNKTISGQFDLSSRLNDYGIYKIFPQVSVGYKITTWLNLDLDYRTIFDKSEEFQFTKSNRWNFNLKVKEKINQLTIGARVRYQFGSSQIYVSQYDADFDNAWRFKGQLKYRSKKSKFNWEIGFETFYNPQYGIYGRSINKNRIGLGLDYEVTSNQSLTLDLIYDKRVNSFYNPNRLAIKTSYTWNFKRKNKEKKTNSVIKNVRDL